MHHECKTKATKGLERSTHELCPAHEIALAEGHDVAQVGEGDDPLRGDLVACGVAAGEGHLKRAGDVPWAYVGPVRDRDVLEGVPLAQVEVAPEELLHDLQLLVELEDDVAADGDGNKVLRRVRVGFHDIGAAEEAVDPGVVSHRDPRRGADRGQVQLEGVAGRDAGADLLLGPGGGGQKRRQS